MDAVVIAGWFDAAKAQGATHMIVVCDEFSWESYPVSVMPGEDVRELEGSYNGKSMQRVMEVYSMSVDKDLQMKEKRAFHR